MRWIDICIRLFGRDATMGRDGAAVRPDSPVRLLVWRRRFLTVMK